MLFAFVTPTTMIIIGIVAVLLFGNRLPKVMRGLGEGITEFKKGIGGIGDTTHDVVDSVKQPIQQITQPLNDTMNDIKRGLGK